MRFALKLTQLLVITLLLNMSISSSSWAVTDDFERASLGTDWAAHADMVIQNGKLHYQGSTSGWKYPAIYKGSGVTNPNSAAISFSSAATDPNYAGVLFVNSASATANGYLVYKSGSSLRLFKITNGEVPASGYQLDSKTATTDVALSAGGTLKVIFKSSNYSFDIYVNNSLVGTVTDITPGHAYNLSTVYAGVIMHGDPTKNKDVELFTAENVSTGSTDTTAPNAVSTLAAGAVTSSTVALTWTATGDDGATGTASQYDLRYSTSAITAANFSSASQVSGEPTPKAAGGSESYTVGGLQASTKYYFALKVGDEVPNWSAISNLPSATTSASSGGSSGGGLNIDWRCADVDQFNRASVGSDWVADNFTILNEELATKSTGTASSWNNIAVYNKAGYIKTANYDAIKISFKLSSVSGNTLFAASAILSDITPANQNGFALYRTAAEMRILSIVNGAIQPTFTSVAKTTTQLAAGAKLTAAIRDSSNNKKRVYFYINDQLDMSFVVDSPLTSYYAGVIEYSNTGKNAIDNFEVCLPGSNDASQMAMFHGDNQTGTINNDVADSLAVIIKNETGQVVEGVPVTFSITQGRAELSVNNTSTFDGKIWKECESGTKGGYATEGTDAGASGGKYITTPGNINQTDTTPLTMTIYSPQDLVYDLWIRYRAPDNNHDRGYFKLDDKDSLYVRVPVSTNWAWYKAGYYTISRGVHTIKVFVTKNPGWDWDKILLSDRIRNSSYIPSGVGGSGPYFSNVSNALGVASTRVRFSTDADTNVVVQALGYKTDGTTLLQGAPVNFTLNPGPGPAAAMRKGSAQDTLKGTPGAQMGEPIQAIVVDSYGNRVSGATVNFTLIRGTGTLSTRQATSNVNGEANTYLTLSLLETFYEIQATATGPTGSALTGSPLTFYVKPGVPPQSLEYVSGNNQEGFSCDRLAAPLIVKVLGKDGNPFPNFPIEFAVTAGNGTVSAMSPESYAATVTVSTGTDGLAKVYWKTGSKAGANTVEARATGLQGTPITFSSVGKADVASSLKIVSGDKQKGPVGVKLDKPLVVKVADKCGENPISGFPVIFTVIQGTDAYINNSSNLNKPVTVLTGSDGTAQVILYMGSAPNEQHLVRVTATGLTPEQVTFEATAGTAVAVALEYVSGNLQDTTVTHPLSKPFVVRTKGPYNTIIANHSVTFRVTKGSGNIGGQVEITTTSDNDGLARATLTVGTAAGDSVNVVEATSTRSDNPNIQLDGSPIRFIAGGNADLPSRVERDETTNNQAAAAGATLAKDIRVRVVDRYGNPILNHNVTFEIQAGGGSFISGTNETTILVVKTGKDGYAASKWKMPVALGPVRCIATAVKENGEGLSGNPVEFIATSVTGDAYKMVKLVTADTLRGTAGRVLEQRLRVRVTDRNDLPKGGYFVTFMATQGGGSVSNGVQSGTQQTVATSADSGIAEVIWTLGTKSGIANNLVEARAAVTVNPTLVFKATANPDAPNRLVEDKTAKDQIGKVGRPLTKPIKVQIVDQYGNGVPAHPVVFTVQGVDSLRGNINGLPFKEVLTDIDGNAQVEWTLGKRPGSRNNALEVTARNGNTLLTNAPYIFYATATIDDPSLIVMVSDTAKLSLGTTRGAALSEPLRVRVTDMFKNAIANQEVVFEVTSSVEAEGGTLGGITDKKVTLKTDSYGLASVIFYAGNKSGYKINRVEARAEFAGNKLNGSPVIFYITGRASNASKIMSKFGNGQTGVVGKYLADELQVIAMDQFNNPVARHPVTFRVIAGVAERGALGADTLTTKIVETGADGIAKVTWRLGRTAGADKNMVEVTSTNGAAALEGSPQLFTAKALPDVTDGKRSKIEAFPVEIPADGSSRSAIQVTLKDRYDNAVSKTAVILDASGTNNIITQPMTTTDVNGQVTGYIASTKAGIKWLHARDLNNQVVLNDSVKVTMKALAAFEIIKANTNHGDSQEGNVGTALPVPLRVYVRDRYGNPIVRFPVLFTPTQGGGQMLDGPQVMTDSTGLAQARYLLGANAGVNFIEAKAFDSSTGAQLNNSPVRFTETGKKSQPSQLTKVSGEGQSAGPGQQLPDPLKVKVLDLSGQPIQGISVKFGVLLNDGNIISTNPVKTDMYGIATATVVVGRTRGVNMYSAYLPDAPAITTVSFTATTENGEATRLTYVSGNDQSGTVNRTLALPLCVRTEDAYGNPVPNVPVNFAVIEDATVQAAGTLAGGLKASIVHSGGDGIACITFTPGTRAGLNRVQATSAGLQPTNIVFSLYGKADYPYCMTDASKTSLRGQVNQPMIDPIQVLVADQYGNPAGGGIVQFVVMPQSGSLVENAVVYSNSNGIASVHWKLGKAGENLALATASLPCGTPQITFRATGETNNYPILALPADQVANETQQLLFNVSATDGDGDQIYINAVRLPDGAVFDEPSGTRQFAWTPTTSQGRTEPYYAVFEVLDSRGGRDLDSVKIVVRNENKAPQWVSKSPLSDNTIVEYPATVEFSVQVVDPDGDQLYYTWKVDNAVAGNSASFFFDSRYYTRGYHYVTVEIFDQLTSITNTWIVDNKSAVEMKSFSTAVVPYQGVQVVWETTREVDNLGFHVYRGYSESGLFSKITVELLPVSTDGKYRFLDKEAQAGQKYYYKIEDLSSSGETMMHGPVMAELALPEKYELSQNYPNPFNPTTQIRYQLPNADKVRITIYNLTGQVVRTLVDAQVQAGYHITQWDGRSDQGSAVGSGIYYYRIETKSYTMTRKMAMLK